MNRKNQELYAAAAEVLNAEAPITLRGLMYRLVSGGFLPDTSKPSYARLGRLMTWARETGHVPMTMIVDHVRATLKPPSWSGLSDFGETVREAYRKDFWASLDCHVAVFCEKDAIAGTIQPTTQEYDVPLHVCRGYVSISFAGEIADQWKRIEKPIFAYYVGDYDPSGFDLERDLREKLARYSDRTDCGLLIDVEKCGLGHKGFAWRRLGVQTSDFEEFGLIELALKTREDGSLSDTRANSFVEEHGKRCAEIDALPPSELRSRIETAILQHVDMKRWKRLQKTERLEQDTVRKLFEKLGA